MSQELVLPENGFLPSPQNGLDQGNDDVDNAQQLRALQQVWVRRPDGPPQARRGSRLGGSRPRPTLTEFVSLGPRQQHE